MNDVSCPAPGERDVSLRCLPCLLVLFAASGCSALIYEIVWFQLLQLVIGSTAVSLCVLLGTFMGGMCVGSLLLPRWIRPTHHPLRVYAALELFLGIIGMAVLFGMPFVDRVYGDVAGVGFAAIAQRGCLCAAVPVAAHRADGCDVACGRALGGAYAARHILARIVVRNQHRRRGDWVSPGRLLLAASPRHGGRDVCRCWAKCGRGSARVRPGRLDAASSGWHDEEPD